MTSPTHSHQIRFQDLPDEALIRLRQMLELHVVPYSASTLWRQCKSKNFPRPIKVSAGVTAWRVGDIRQHFSEIERKHEGERS